MRRETTPQIVVLICSQYYCTHLETPNINCEIDSLGIGWGWRWRRGSMWPSVEDVQDGTVLYLGLERVRAPYTIPLLYVLERSIS